MNFTEYEASGALGRIEHGEQCEEGQSGEALHGEVCLCRERAIWAAAQAETTMIADNAGALSAGGE